MAGASTARS